MPMKWPQGGLDPWLCRAINPETGEQCPRPREKHGKKALRTYCRAHRFRLEQHGALYADQAIMTKVPANKRHLRK